MNQKKRKNEIKSEPEPGRFIAAKAKREGIEIFVLVAIIISILFWMGGYHAGVPQEEYDKVLAELDTWKRQADNSRSAYTNELEDEEADASAFRGNCGISASAEIRDSLLGSPKLSVFLVNETEKDITGIGFFVVLYDRYGKEMTGWRLCAERRIGADESAALSFQLTGRGVRTIQLYLYCISYADGSVWGNPDAKRSEILEQGVIIDVSSQLWE